MCETLYFCQENCKAHVSTLELETRICLSVAF